MPELVPIRYGRMLVSPFTFFRGAALIMAADLARTPTHRAARRSCAATRTCRTSACSPSPERNLVFDINDFDETLPGPWEWDVKRLAASLRDRRPRQRLHARQRRERSCSRRSRAYREAMAAFAEHAQPRRLVRPLRRRRGDARSVPRPARRPGARKRADKDAGQGAHRTACRRFAKLTARGRRRAAHRQPTRR